MQNQHGGNLRAAQAKFGLSAEEFLDFSANINPLGPSAGVLQTLKDNLHRIKDYPDPDCKDLRQAYSSHWQVPVEYLLAGNGAVELIYVLMQALKPQRVLLLAPTFSEYATAAQAAGTQIVHYMLERDRDWRPDVDQLLAQMSGVDMVILCNPNNPTGQLLSKSELLRLVGGALDSKVTVVLDEAFVDFLPDQLSVSMMSEITNFANLVILRSLTKFLAIPGLRLGLLVGHPELIGQLHGYKDPWSVNVLAQLAGIQGLKDHNYITQSINMIQQEKSYLYQAISSIKQLHPFPPTVNYMLMELTNTSWTSVGLVAELGQRGILVRDCANYKNLTDKYIRVAIKDHEANVKLVNCLHHILAED